MSGVARVLLSAVFIVAGLTGCDGQDPERLSKVGKKLAEKGQKFADESQLPKVEVTFPKLDKDKTEKTKPAAKDNSPPAPVK